MGEHNCVCACVRACASVCVVCVHLCNVLVSQSYCHHVTFVIVRRRWLVVCKVTLLSAVCRLAIVWPNVTIVISTCFL